MTGRRLEDDRAVLGDTQGGVIQRKAAIYLGSDDLGATLTRRTKMASQNGCSGPEKLDT